MSVNVRDVLNRRNDLSTFVVHLTKDGADQSAKERLESIIERRVIVARTAMGWAADTDDPTDATQQTQRVVSFTETPLEHIYSHVVEITGRREWFQPYGIALTKLAARRHGINPIWYVDQTPGRDWDESQALNELKDQAIASGQFHQHPIAKLLPFFEQMGTWTASGGTQKEFWWEREWRKRGSLVLPVGLEGCLVLCPEDQLDHFEQLLRPSRLRRAIGGGQARCIDPRWGLEQIVAHLAGISPNDITPFGPEAA